MQSAASRVQIHTKSWGVSASVLIAPGALKLAALACASASANNTAAPMAPDLLRS
jgi:hypothetical protein